MSRNVAQALVPGSVPTHRDAGRDESVSTLQPERPMPLIWGSAFVVGRAILANATYFLQLDLAPFMNVAA